MHVALDEIFIVRPDLPLPFLLKILQPQALAETESSGPVGAQSVECGQCSSGVAS